MMKRLLFTFCASLLMVFAAAVRIVGTEALLPVPPSLYICEGIIDKATKALYTGEKPRGWKLAGFDDSSWTDVQFPLAEKVVCPQLQAYGPPGGPFPENQRILTRNVFTLNEIPSEAKLILMADNFARLFVNGVLVFTTPPSNDCAGVATEYEVDLSKFAASPFVIGENVVAVNGQDYGGQSFLNVHLDIVSSKACDGQQLTVDLSPFSYYWPDHFVCDVISGPTKALFTGEKPRGWKERGFNDEAWTDASFPLAENVSCPQLQTYGLPGGPFPANTRIVTRNTFYIPNHPSFEFQAVIYVVADSHAKVFVNGVQVFETPDESTCEGVAKIHEVVLWQDINQPLVIGENVVAVNAQSSSGQSFVNVRMVIEGAQPCDTF